MAIKEGLQELKYNLFCLNLQIDAFLRPEAWIMIAEGIA